MKIRVKENIGKESFYEFGGVGTEFTVRNGMFTNLRSMVWSEWSKHECTIEALNEYFGVEDQYQTVFELVEE